MAIWALSAIFGWIIGGRSEDKPVRDWTAWLLGIPSGRWLVAGFGVMIAAIGLGICVKAFNANLDRRLGPKASRHPWIAMLGRIGLLGRALVAVLIGAFLIEAAVSANSRHAKGLAGALASLQQYRYGWILLGLAAVGTLAFGAFEFAQTAYRKIDVPRL